MSWFSDLAGKAENILNKIDQNAATVLQHQQQQHQQKSQNNNNNKHDDVLIDIKGEENHLAAISPSAPLLLNKKLNNPNTTLSIVDNNTNHQPIINNNYCNVSNENDMSDLNNSLDKNSNSNLSSRRSSFGSRPDGDTVIERGITSVSPSTDVNGIGLKTIKSSPSLNSTEILSKEHLVNELAATKIVLAEIQSERDELKCENDNLMEQSKSVNNQVRINELNEYCNRLELEKQDVFQKCITLENSNTNYIKSISELETTISKLHQNENDLSEKLKWTKIEMEQIKNELQQYRSRAQVTLKEKEKLIEQLKGGGGCGDAANIAQNQPNDDTVFKEPINIIDIEYKNLMNERQNLYDDIQTLNAQLLEIKNYVETLEKNKNENISNLEAKLQSTNEILKLEQRKIMENENDLKTQTQELLMVREEMERQRLNYSKKIHDKDIELNKFRTKLAQQNSNINTNTNTTNNGYSLNNYDGMENRIQSLTQSLVQKQNKLETVTAERNALRLQMEKQENQYRNSIRQLHEQSPLTSATSSQIINVNDTDDIKARIPNFLQENPFDTRVARRVKRAYNSLDSVGVRLGVFLRRYPLVRIMVIVYVFVLHMWVMLVLFSSTPN